MIFRRNYISELTDIVFGRKSVREFMKRRSSFASVRAVEIGTFKGDNATVILRVLKPTCLVCVDPYKEYPEMPSEIVRTAEQAAHRRLRGKPVRWVRSIDRMEIIRQIGNIDYLYIDGAHDYENVRADIDAYWPCVKKGGMMSGHDICWSSVFKAVSEFTVKTGMPVCAYDTDWWVWKPSK